MNWQLLEQQARRELEDEERRRQIEEIKEKLRKQNPKWKWWNNFFPFKIKIERITKNV